ncbi:MAG: radical SAM protein, partial [Acidobacteria bacterium]|nr:radical SAM protein [Acidobacteriota bacterium]
EAYRLVDQICSFERPFPLFVLTGGDPMWRKDLADIVRYASGAGLTVALTPSGTAAATRARLTELKDAGLTRVAVSLDGPDPEMHDSFRRVRGSYMYTMKIIDAVIELGLPLQINTTVSRLTLPTLKAMARRVAEFPMTLWAVFFLIQTGRGASLDQITAAECEDVLDFLYDLSRTALFGIKTTEAPHYRRVIWQRGQAEAGAGLAGNPLEQRRQLRAPRGVNDGNGFVFVDHIGDIYPSGFLPEIRGNVRSGDLARTYRDDGVFKLLRDPDALHGRCGLCRFRAICGGSRARAYATSGDELASDPLCVYQPDPRGEANIGGIEAFTH